MKNLCSPGALITLSLLSARSLSAAILWTEATQGDLSGDHLNPTGLTLALGENRIIGRMGRDEPFMEIDRDIFTFTLAPGSQLTSIRVLGFEGSGGAGSFYAVAPGSNISITDPSGHLSNMLVNQTGEILDDLSAGAYAGGTGLPNPVGPGTYTVWFQEAGAEIGYDFAYTVVPEPAEYAAVSAVGLLAFVGIRWQRRRRLARAAQPGAGETV
jgi:hypothetical protein